jgi:hypothetical protein
MEDGWLQIFDRVDQGRRLIVTSPRTENRLYKLHITPTVPVDLMLNITDTAWLWLARYGHLNFRALRKLVRRDTANGIPVVTMLSRSVRGAHWENNTEKLFPRHQLIELRKA